MAKDITVNVKAVVDDSEVKGLESEIEELDNNDPDVQVTVEDGEIDGAKAKEEELNTTAQVDIEVDDTAVQTAMSNIQDGINQTKQGLSELGQGMGEVLESAGRMEQTETFLTMNLGADKAKQKLTDIRNVTDALPGDDVVLQNLLSQAAIKQPDLAADGFEEMGNAAADYMAAMQNYGKTSTETQQDLMNYILAGNTAEVQLSPILQSHIDDLKAATTPRERALALQQALNEEHWGGIASQDTYNNKLQTFTDLIERGKMNFGGFFLEASKGAMGFIGDIDQATGGILGMGVAFASEFGPGLLQGTQGLISMGAGLSTMGKEFGGVLPMVKNFAGQIPLIGGALSGLSLGPVALAIAAIVALGVAIYEIGKSFGWWTDVSSMFEAIGAGAQRMWDAFMNNEGVIMIIEQIKDAFNNLMSFLGEVGGVIAEALGFDTMGGEFDIVSAAINFLGQVGNAVLPVVSGLIHYVKEACAALAPVVMWVIQNVIIPHFQGLYTVAMAIWPAVSAIVSGAIGVIRGVISGAMAIWSGLQSAWRTLQSTASSVFSAISGVVSSAGGAWNSFKSTVMGAIQPIIDKINDLKNAASGVGDFIGGLFGGGGGASYGMGAGAISGISASGGDTIFNITINGNVDSDARINQLKEDFASIIDGERKEEETIVG